MPERESTGQSLPEPEPEPGERPDAVTLEQQARQLRAQTLRRMFLSLFRRRPAARAVPAQPARCAPAPDADETPRKAA